MSWRLDELLPKDTVIDFSKRILSDALTGTEGIGCLSAEEKLMLNQIRSNSYAHLILFLEEYSDPRPVPPAHARQQGGD